MDTRSHTILAARPDNPLPFLTVASLAFLFAANTLDMGGAMGLKYASYIPAAILGGIGLGRVRLDLRAANRLLFLFLAYPFFAFFLGIAAGSDPLLAASQITPFFPAVLLFAFLLQLEPGDVRPYRIFCWSVFSLSLVVIVIFPLLLWFPDRAPVAHLLEALSSPRIGFFGTRKTGELDLPGTYFRATLFLVPAFAYFHLTGRKAAAWLSFLGLALSLSRAGILLCVALYAGNAMHRGKFAPMLGAVAGAAAVHFLFPDLARYALEAFSLKGETTQVRLRHLDSLLTLFDENPLRLLFGQGAGAEFFSAGAGAEVANIEIDHFNAIRKFGLIWFLPFLYLLIRTATKLIGGGTPEKSAIGVSLVLMFLAAGTNPVFVSPLFFLAFVAALHAAQEEPTVRLR